FQKYFGLTVTGKADLKTLLKVEETANTPFQKGKRHKNTTTLKRNLNKLGFSGITVTTLYGSYTEKKVKEFQKYYGLRVNGLADTVTMKKVDDIINSSLQKGKRNSQTTTIKKKLNHIGFGGITVTTLYGSFTEKRVKDFQRYYDLKVNGIADDKTLSKINEVYNS